MELCWGRWCIRCFYNPRSCIRPALFRFKENGTGSHVVDAISSIRANSRTNSILKVDFHNILYIYYYKILFLVSFSFRGSANDVKLINHFVRLGFYEVAVQFIGYFGGGVLYIWVCMTRRLFV
jgi:hypothetical protein